MNAHFPDEIVLRDAGMRGDSRTFRLARYFRYISSRGTITVPCGFLTDGASVPRVFWGIFDPWGPYFPAALIHDWLYSRSSTGRVTCDRATADAVFLEAMERIGVGWAKRRIIYRAVRLGGWASWKKR